jgi:phosphoribosylanthranilate isomerase
MSRRACAAGVEPDARVNDAKRELRGAPRVKICGLTRVADAQAAAEAGADYLGVISSSGFSRSLDPRAAATVLAGLDPPRVAVTVDERPDDAARIADAIGASVLQLHGSESRADVEALRSLGSWTVWKAVRARSLQDVRSAVDALHHVVDGFLVEGWREGVVGGGGVRVDVDGAAVRSTVSSDRTFLLAGGLNVDNVAEAVDRFAPDVVDVSSGVEREPGHKDPVLVARFIASARRIPLIPRHFVGPDTP